MEELKMMIENIDEDVTCSGKQLKELLDHVMDLCEFEIECQKKVHKFHKTITNFYKNRVDELEQEQEVLKLHLDFWKEQRDNEIASQKGESRNVDAYLALVKYIHNKLNNGGIYET